MEPEIEFGWTDACARIHHGWLTPAIKELLPSPGDKQTLLDMGCGSGVMAARYRDWGFTVVGTEVSAEGLEQARSADPEVTFVQASAYDDHATFGPPGGFDVVVSTEVIEHLIDPEAMLQRAYEAVRPGGTVIVTTPYHGYVKNLAISLANGWDDHWDVARRGWHIKFFSTRTLEAMLTSVGFVDLSLRGAGRRPMIWRSIVAKGTRPSH